jgi:hypothetical protein
MFQSWTRLVERLDFHNPLYWQVHASMIVASYEEHSTKILPRKF